VSTAVKTMAVPVPAAPIEKRDERMEECNAKIHDLMRQIRVVERWRHKEWDDVPTLSNVLNHIESHFGMDVGNAVYRAISDYELIQGELQPSIANVLSAWEFDNGREVL